MKVKPVGVKKARIEMLPLIDIVFLLLVFFIYAMLSMAVHRGLPVELPVSTTAEIDKKLVLSVTIDAQGKHVGTFEHVRNKGIELFPLQQIRRSKQKEAVLLSARHAFRQQSRSSPGLNGG